MKFFKKNIILIISLFILLVWLILGVNNYLKEYGYDIRVSQINNSAEQCYNADYLHDEEIFDVCSSIVDLQKNPLKERVMDDTLTVYFEIMFNQVTFYISFVIPFFLIIVAVCFIHKELKSGFIIHRLEREKYNMVLKKLFVNGYFKIFSFILLLVFVFVCSYFISGHFNYHEGVNSYKEGLLIYSNFPFYLIIYVLNIIFHFIYIFNLSYIMCSKNKNLFIVLVSTYLLWIGIGIFFEIIVPTIMYYLFGIKLRYIALNMFAIYTWRIDKGSMIPLIFSISLCVLSFICLWFTYRNKEKLVKFVEE